MIYRYSIIVFCLLCLFSCDKRANIRDGIPQAHDSISNRKKDTFSDSIPLEQTLIPPKQIDDLHNFQVVYCLDVYGDRKFVWCHIHNFCFKGKLYEPRFMIAYRKSVTDTLADMHGLGFLERPKWEYEKDRALYNWLKEDWNFDDSKKIQLYNDKLIDNGRTLKIEAINYNEYYCYDNNMLVIYKFVDHLVFPILEKEGDILHMPYIFEDTKHFMNDNTK